MNLLANSLTNQALLPPIGLRQQN